MLVSPYARGRRLGVEISRRRTAARITTEKLGTVTGLGRSAISRIENYARRTDVDDVLRVIEALGIEYGTDQHRQLHQIARDAAASGWWESRDYRSMGPRQALIANLESGATSIREYAPNLIPGLLQTEAYTAYRIRAAGRDDPAATPDAIIAGRLARQEAAFGPRGPELKIVVEEAALRRRPVPSEVMLEQLHHLLNTMERRTNVSLRVLLVDAQLADGYAPRSPFAIHTYPDAEDLEIVAVDTVAEDLILVEKSEVDEYVELFDRLHGAALPEEDSADLIRTVAAKLEATIRS